jgi:hypothetical protein
MKGRTVGFRYLLLLIVLAALYFLFAREARTVSPALSQLRELREAREHRSASAGAKTLDTTSLDAAGAPAPGPVFPRLTDMQQQTDQHASDVAGALKSE